MFWAGLNHCKMVDKNCCLLLLYLIIGKLDIVQYYRYIFIYTIIIILFYCLYSHIFIYYYHTGVHSTIQLPHDTVQCLNQTVEYQCTVSGSGLLALIWSVFRDDGTQLGNDFAYVSSTILAPSTIGGLFTVEQLSMTPLVSNISFTAMSSIDRYTVVCEDLITLNNETILINIAGNKYTILQYLATQLDFDIHRYPC